MVMYSGEYAEQEAAQYAYGYDDSMAMAAGSWFSSSIYSIFVAGGILGCLWKLSALQDEVERIKMSIERRPDLLMAGVKKNPSRSLDEVFAESSIGKGIGRSLTMPLLVLRTALMVVWMPIKFVLSRGVMIVYAAVVLSSLLLVLYALLFQVASNTFGEPVRRSMPSPSDVVKAGFLTLTSTFVKIGDSVASSVYTRCTGIVDSVATHAYGADETRKRASVMGGMLGPPQHSLARSQKRGSTFHWGNENTVERSKKGYR